MKTKLILSMALVMGAMTFTSCNNDDDKNNDETAFSVIETTPLVDEDNYNPNTTAGNYSVKSFGEGAVDGCADVVSELEAANAIIGSAKLSEDQETYLREVLKNLVNNVIVPTYTKLADNTEALEKTLHGLTSSTITQAQIDEACKDLQAELSAVFLMARISRLPACIGSRARLSLVVPLPISMSILPSTHGL